MIGKRHHDFCHGAQMAEWVTYNCQLAMQLDVVGKVLMWSTYK
jgi:hypothetical protein